MAKANNKKVVIIAARNTEALANYLYFNREIYGMLYAFPEYNINERLVYAINGFFREKDIKGNRITNREMTIIRMVAIGNHPKSIARDQGCSVKTIYSHRRNAELKLFFKISRMIDLNLNKKQQDTLIHRK